MPFAERLKDKSHRFTLLPEGSENLPAQSIFACRTALEAGRLYRTTNRFSHVQQAGKRRMMP